MRAWSPRTGRAGWHQLIDLSGSKLMFLRSRRESAATGCVRSLSYSLGYAHLLTLVQGPRCCQIQLSCHYDAPYMLMQRSGGHLVSRARIRPRSDSGPHLVVCRFCCQPAVLRPYFCTTHACYQYGFPVTTSRMLGCACSCCKAGLSVPGCHCAMWDAQYGGSKAVQVCMSNPHVHLYTVCKSHMPVLGGFEGFAVWHCRQVAVKVWKCVEQLGTAFTWQ